MGINSLNNQSKFLFIEKKIIIIIYSLLYNVSGMKQFTIGKLNIFPSLRLCGSNVIVLLGATCTAGYLDEAGELLGERMFGTNDNSDTYIVGAVPH